MGEAKRRRLAELRDPLVLPTDVKDDIAASVRSIDFVGHPGGACFFRVLTGMCLLQMLNMPTNLMLGGMVYRAGPDQFRDVVAYCGPDNHGTMTPGRMILGHWWIENDDEEVIDFSCGDWTYDMRPDRAPPENTLIAPGIYAADDKLGPVQWDAPPPDYLWVPRRQVEMIAGQRSPKLGRFYYTGWKGETPPPDMFDDFDIHWPSFITHFLRCCDFYDLFERVPSARGRRDHILKLAKRSEPIETKLAA